MLIGLMILLLKLSSWRRREMKLSFKRLISTETSVTGEIRKIKNKNNETNTRNRNYGYPHL